MRIIQLDKNYENITIPFSDGTSMEVTADFQGETVVKALRMINAAGVRAKEIEAISDPSEQEKQVAEMLAEVVVLLIGEKDYKELIARLGGDGENPATVNFQMTIIWTELVEMVKERGETFNKSKASHYLAEYYRGRNASD